MHYLRTVAIQTKKAQYGFQGTGDRSILIISHRRSDIRAKWKVAPLYLNDYGSQSKQNLHNLTRWAHSHSHSHTLKLSHFFPCTGPNCPMVYQITSNHVYIFGPGYRWDGIELKITLMNVVIYQCFVQLNLPYMTFWFMVHGTCIAYVI